MRITHRPRPGEDGAWYAPYTLARFQATTPGTSATLCDIWIYDITEAGSDQPTTNERPTNDH